MLSGLILIEKDTTGTEDGILHLNEVYNLQLNADLVVLSACETGRGKLIDGEGVIGLARGFLYAGAQNVLMSLRQVNDAPTKDLMVTFYEALLLGQTRAEALQTSKRWMISRPSARPSDWAWFVLIGT